MSVRQVRFLEADDYEALHGMATARGFVRAYARILQMDPEPLVASFADKKKTSAPAGASQGKSAEPFVKNREPFREKTGEFRQDSHSRDYCCRSTGCRVEYEFFQFYGQIQERIS